MDDLAAPAAEQARLVEVDAHMRLFNVALAVASALVAPAFLPAFGAVFTGFLFLPLIWWGLRLLGLAERIGLERWILGLLAVVTICVAGGAATSGGTDSPIVFFAGIVGVGGQAFFPTRRWTTASGVLIVAIVATADLVSDQQIQLFDTVCASILAAYLPFLVRRLVDLEQLHRHSAVIDTLTGCLNRRSLETRIEEIETHASRTGGPISVISFDLDRFKSVNDEHGHAAGDRVLEHVAYVVRKNLRRFELVYRLGGEEFAVLLPETDLATAAELAERLRRSIADSDADGLSITASFGVASAVPPLSVEDILETADRRVYRAKDAGRNQVFAGDDVVVRRLERGADTGR